MDKSTYEIAAQHAEIMVEMEREHLLEIAKMYKLHGLTLEDLIEYLVVRLENK